jgi:hypothetical protein
LIGRAYSTHGAKINAYRIFVGKPEEKRPLEKPRCRWEDNIKMDLRDIDWGDMNGFIWFKIGASGGPS